jgi:hypothetical protein
MTTTAFSTVMFSKSMIIILIGKFISREHSKPLGIQLSVPVHSQKPEKISFKNRFQFLFNTIFTDTSLLSGVGGVGYRVDHGVS